ncbi:MAG: HisA/HisF-related TIM barrel protein [Actinomycetota bacterium]
MYAGEPRFIPTLLLRDGQLVKTRRFEEPVYVGDAINVLSIFNDFEVDEIVLLDIDGAHRRTPAGLDELRRYAEECFIPLAYGGGLTTIDDIAAVLEVGFEKIVVNTITHDNPEVVTQASDRFGAQAIVASIDVRGGADGEVYVRGGKVATGIDPVHWAERTVALGAGELLVTSIDREGTFEGIDLELVRRVTDAVGVPVIAHGGAEKRKTLGVPVHEANAAAVAAGSLFVFQGQDRSGVLVNYPSRRQIERLIERDAASTTPAPMPIGTR